MIIDSNNNQKVSREKLTQLWIDKRKKAIAIIKNNGLWPKIVQVSITPFRNEQYYMSS